MGLIDEVGPNFSSIVALEEYVVDVFILIGTEQALGQFWAIMVDKAINGEAFVKKTPKKGSDFVRGIGFLDQGEVLIIDGILS